MVADNWFRQVGKILEAIEITSDATRIKLAAFQLEGEYGGIRSKPQGTWRQQHKKSSMIFSWENISKHLLDMQNLGSS